MPLRTLELGILHLANRENNLKLSVLSAANIRIPQGISGLEDDAILKALTSGNLWVSRGVACHLDIRILFNGKKLGRSGRVNLLESLGYRIRDAQLWSQLSLSASLDVWQSDDPANLATDLSIKIKHGTDPPIPQTRVRAWTLDNFDVKVPESVLCAEFESMQIHFEFLNIQKKAEPGQKVKFDTGECDAQEVMLLDPAPGLVGYGSTDDLGNTVERMKGFPDLIERCFEPRVASNDHFTPLPLSSWGQYHASHKTWQIRDRIEEHPGKEKSNGSKKLGHSKETIKTLTAWLEGHRCNPYPSTAEKQELMKVTGLKLHQVNNWFQHHRRRLRRETSLKKDKIPLQQTEEEFASLGDFDNQEDNETLFSHITDNIPSLTSQTTVASSFLSIGDGNMSLKRPFAGDEAMSLGRPAACELGDIAIHILVSGHIGRALGALGDVKVETPPPSLSLSRIVPATFSPGFKMSIAQNAHFVPTISHVVSVSWPRNVQSPTLQQKLTQLANSPPSLLTGKIRELDRESGITAGLAAVVQSRLWGIMQRKLYDPFDAAKIWKKFPLGENPCNDEYVDLLESLGKPNGGEVGVMRELGGFSEDEMDEFEDLLSADDDELLRYLEERERVSVERETDEMLFRCEWDEVEDDECLLDGEARSDAMLL